MDNLRSVVKPSHGFMRYDEDENTRSRRALPTDGRLKERSTDTDSDRPGWTVFTASRQREREARWSEHRGGNTDHSHSAQPFAAPGTQCHHEAVASSGHTHTHTHSFAHKGNNTPRTRRL